jgi:hypothetical protein
LAFSVIASYSLQHPTHRHLSGNVDSITHEIAIALLNDIAKMNADAKIDASIGRQACIALDHAAPHLDCATYSFNDAAEFDQSAIAGSLDDTPVMYGDGWIDQIAA